MPIPPTTIFSLGGVAPFRPNTDAGTMYGAASTLPTAAAAGDPAAGGTLPERVESLERRMIDDARRATDPRNRELDVVFQFEHVGLDHGPHGKWWPRRARVEELVATFCRWQTGLAPHGWNSLYWGNHDQPRPVSRFGDDGPYRVESAKMLATFVHMLQGTPYVYQGEEIGMTNVAFETIDDYRDIQTLNLYREMVDEKGLSPEELMPIFHAKSRDNARTPMQWDAGPNAGFTTGTPWIKVNPNYMEINVEQALADPNSVFYYYRELIQLRKANPVIVHGAYDLLLDDDEAIYAFTRTLAHDRLLIILNFTGDTPVFSLPGDLKFSGKALLISNYPVDEAQPLRAMTLRPYEARVYRLT